jgi:hypothetical protein
VFGLATTIVPTDTSKVPQAGVFHQQNYNCLKWFWKGYKGSGGETKAHLASTTPMHTAAARKRIAFHVE